MTEQDRGQAPKVDAPLFSVVSAVYNVERYLDEFIDSLEQQTFPLDRLEVVAVDDGSSDSSLERLQAWQRDSRIRIQILTKENGGQATARNLGLEHASGAWVTFTDPDDAVAPDYFEQASTFLDEYPDIDMMVAQFVRVDDATRELSKHPLRSMFRDGNVPRRLEEGIDFFTGSAPASFFRRDRLLDEALRFDERIRPNFEDGHFTACYLLGVADPVVGFLGRAHYFYRKRSDGSSTLQRSLTHPGRYTSVLRHGYLDALERGRKVRGAAPGWLQALIIYDLSWFFSADERGGGVHAGRGAVADEFHGLLGEICSLLDPEVINEFRARPLKREWRHILLHGYRQGPWHQDRATVTRYDEQRGLMRLSYYYVGGAPDERIRVRGKVVEPYAAKVRDVISHDRVLLHERIVWVSARASVRVQLDGRDVAIDVREQEPSSRTMVPRLLKREQEQTRGVGRGPALDPEQRRLVRWARSAPVRRIFGDAWVLMDRIHDADDSGEHLFRFLRRERRSINAWFVIEKGSADWKRLRRAGYRRVVPFGSLRWKLLMLNCRHLISSHADQPVIRPPELDFVEPEWRFTFLQHGVIKDDLSTWLNGKPIEVFVTSTKPEYESIVSDHTTYTFTSKETVLTGLPRFDLLRSAGQRVGPEQRDLVLLTPTWRNWLLPPLLPGTQRRAEVGDEFLTSEFLQGWLGLLRSPEIADACRRRGLTLAFLPHPNLQAAISDVPLPDHVQLLDFVGNDVRELFARAALLVTDYSSMAFNAAYIDRPVVYYQFDRERVLAGEHVGRAGYFDYARDGFGPVTTDHEQAVAAILSALEHGPVPTAEYADRIAETFPIRDGRCCERVTRAIRQSGRRLSVAQAGVPLDRLADVLSE